jgi:hypothetical protein
MAKNITLAVDEEVLAKYRVLAAEQGTSVNALIRKHMEEATGVAERRRKAREWMRRKGEENIARDAARLAEGTSAAEGEAWRWSREEIYANRLSRLAKRD